MRTLEIVEVLPLLELDVEDLRVVDDLADGHAVELLIVDAMRPLDLAVKPRGQGSDVDMAKSAVQEMPVEGRLELGPVVGLDLLDSKRQLLEDVVGELDCGLLVQLPVDLQDSQPRAVVDSGELVVLLAHTADGINEFDVDLNGEARSLLLVMLPALLVALVTLGGR
jgi:hypothetical protein